MRKTKEPREIIPYFTNYGGELKAGDLVLIFNGSYGNVAFYTGISKANNPLFIYPSSVARAQERIDKGIAKNFKPYQSYFNRVYKERCVKIPFSIIAKEDIKEDVRKAIEILEKQGFKVNY